VTFSREKDGHVTFELLSVKFDFQVINLVAWHDSDGRQENCIIFSSSIQTSLVRECRHGGKSSVSFPLKNRIQFLRCRSKTKLLLSLITQRFQFVYNYIKTNINRFHVLIDARYFHIELFIFDPNKPNHDSNFADETRTFRITHEVTSVWSLSTISYIGMHRVHRPCTHRIQVQFSVRDVIPDRDHEYKWVVSTWAFRGIAVRLSATCLQAAHPPPPLPQLDCYLR